MGGQQQIKDHGSNNPAAYATRARQIGAGAASEPAAITGVRAVLRDHYQPAHPVGVGAKIEEGAVVERGPGAVDRDGERLLRVRVRAVSGGLAARDRDRPASSLLHVGAAWVSGATLCAEG